MPDDWANWINVALNLTQFVIVVVVGRAMWRRLRAADAATAAQATSQWQESRTDRADLRTQLAGVQTEIGTLKSDQTNLRVEVANQRETLNRIVARLNRMPTQQDMELGLIALQGNIALILSGRPPAPISLTQHNEGGGPRGGGTQFTGPATIQGPMAGGNIGLAPTTPPGKTEGPHTI